MGNRRKLKDTATTVDLVDAINEAWDEIEDHGFRLATLEADVSKLENEP